MNPIDILKAYMTNGLTPKGIVMNIVGKNPIFSNLIQMAENGDSDGVEKFARNMLKERGLDFDKELNNFKKSLNIQ